jgi:hypothetical protein
MRRQRRHGTSLQPASYLEGLFSGGSEMGRGILLWLLGVPIPVIILLWLFFGHWRPMIQMMGAGSVELIAAAAAVLCVLALAADASRP